MINKKCQPTESRKFIQFFENIVYIDTVKDNYRKSIMVRLNSFIKKSRVI